MKKLNNKKGFTLVELVIVIAVIAILSAILIPTFSNVIKNANDTKAQAEVKAAITQYLGNAPQKDVYDETNTTEVVDGITFRQEVINKEGTIFVYGKYNYTYKNGVLSTSNTNVVVNEQDTASGTVGGCTLGTPVPLGGDVYAVPVTKTENSTPATT